METTFGDISQVLGAYLPKFLAALAILVIGWLAARIIGAAVNAGFGVRLGLARSGLHAGG